jgi:hypothetical protein
MTSAGEGSTISSHAGWCSMNRFSNLTIPIRIFQGQDDNPRLFDGQVKSLFGYIPLFAFSWDKNKKITKESKEPSVGLICSLHPVRIFQADMRIRYVGAAIPPLVILSVLGIRDVIGALTSGRER